jgi:glycosyltransferase involved in cell wall biosynthesis
VVVSPRMTDKELAKCYSACDVTLGIGSGEGFGFPLAESLACGVPVIHGMYGGGMEFVPPLMQVKPVAFRLETPLNRVCPVFEPADWAEAVINVLPAVYNEPAPEYREFCRNAVLHLDWNVLWPKWHQWFLEGIR